MTIQEYLDKINKRFKTGISTEHTYRGDLQTLLESLSPNILVTNEPERVACGAPDFILTKNQIPIGYIEAKDIGADLKSRLYKEQFNRYIAGLPNLIFTDYLEFHFYQNGEFKTSIRIADIQNNQIKPITENFEHFESLIANFCLFIGQTIRSSRKLAEMMAAKAKLLADVIEKALNSDEETKENSSIKEQMTAFKEILIHDIDAKEFADIYAQTIAYGMFSARLHDPNLDTFSREEAALLIPKTNPFLRKLFQYVAGYDLDQRLVWIVESLADIFRATDIKALLKNFGKATHTHDPIIHFYETFLSSYDAKLRKARGVWYTPEPVVNFIVRAVDDILKSEFGLNDALADTSKTKIKTKVFTKATSDQRSKIKEEFVETEVHKVQILDPATGTGTFLAEVVKQIYKKFEGQQGIWSNYVENHLIPRLNGFELLMASYAMAHLKLDLLMTETGFKPTKEQRFRIYLTNSLEEHHPDTGTLFANWLSTEANEANHIKRDTPVMVVLGNPPYAVSSSNKSDWIQNLIADYKVNLNEKKINLDDDYIKFIRYGQHFIDKNGSGILAYISNNSFIDGITHRQMRKHLLESFDKIYILDLHGSSKRNELKPNKDKDENVFDIMQGVSINLFIKTSNSKKAAAVNHFDLFGRREEKYQTLIDVSFKGLEWKLLQPKEPYFFFVPKDFNSAKSYNSHLRLDELFLKFGNGIGTDRDALFYDMCLSDLKKKFQKFYSSEGVENPFKSKYNIKNSSSYNLLTKRLNTVYDEKFIKRCLYRPFDKLFLYHNPDLLSRPANGIMSQLSDKNIALLVTRQLSSSNFRHVFISDIISDRDPLSVATRERTQLFPLYIYENKSDERLFGNHSRTPNLNAKIVNQIAANLSLSFTDEKESNRNTFAPIDILDYIYAVLHSPAYREKYKEFLKIDFPRVPYPKDKETFWQLVKLGGELRQINLLESPVVEKYITQYPVTGSNVVDKIKYSDNKVFINATQYFENVPEIAWEFYIGGYQPAQKWLKDRKGRELNFEDILHYQKIIVALTETDRLMKEIDKIEID